MSHEDILSRLSAVYNWGWAACSAMTFGRISLLIQSGTSEPVGVSSDDMKFVMKDSHSLNIREETGFEVRIYVSEEIRAYI